MTHMFRRRLRDGELLVGTLATLPAPEISEVLADLLFDWLFIDTEHGSFDAVEAQALLQAAGSHCPCLVRVPAGRLTAAGWPSEQVAMCTKCVFWA